MKKWNIGNLWKKYKYVGLVVLAGILLMLLPGKKSDAQTQEGGGSFSLEDTERRMEELLGRMDGVGRVQVVVTRETYPVYLGAVVVCQGAGSGGVRLAVTEAVAALTGLPADRITVVQWDS